MFDKREEKDIEVYYMPYNNDHELEEAIMRAINDFIFQLIVFLKKI